MLDTKPEPKSMPATKPLSNTSRRRWPRLAALAIAAAAVSGAIYGGILSRGQAEESLARATSDAAVPSVTIIHPTAGAPQNEIALPGYTQAFMDTPVSARTSGYLKVWRFDIGARVRKGDLLAKIDSPEVDHELDQAKGQLAQDEAAVKQAQANAELARVTNNRTATLVQEGWNTEQRGDQDRLNYTAQTAAVAVAEANVTAQRSAVGRLEELVGFERIVAPFDGVITARNTDVGALIDAGANSPSKELFHLAAIDTLRIFVAVPEAYARAAQPGTTASVTLDEFPGRSFPGALVRNANAIDLSSRTLLVEVDVANPDGLLLPGAYTFVHLSLPGADGTVTVPSNTLLFRRQGLQVAIVRNGRTQLVPVTIGRDYGEKVEILTGLHATDDVIVDPSDSLISGTAVLENEKQG
jgi:RND family efflux transporter MFP subunit